MMAERLDSKDPLALEALKNVSYSARVTFARQNLSCGDMRTLGLDLADVVLYAQPSELATVLQKEMGLVSCNPLLEAISPDEALRLAYL